MKFKQFLKDWRFALIFGIGGALFAVAMTFLVAPYFTPTAKAWMIAYTSIPGLGIGGLIQTAHNLSR